MSEELSQKQLTIIDLLNNLTDEQRLEIFHKYCTHCGGQDMFCQCWNDE